MIIQLPDVGEDVGLGKCGTVKKPLCGRVENFLKSVFLFRKLLPGS